MKRAAELSVAVSAALLLLSLSNARIGADSTPVSSAPRHASAGTSGPTASVSDPVVLPGERGGLKGVVAHWWYLDRYGAPLLDHFTWLGVTSVRLTIDWLQFEPAEGQYRFEAVDRFMDAFLDRGIDVVPVVATIPAWASLNPGGCKPDNSMLCYLNIAKLPAFEASMRRLVGRYPDVTRWEFWNEPEMWLSMRDGDRYEPWYQAFYRAAKQANPNARVAVGTLTGWDFFRQLSPDVPVDAVSVHSYAGEHWALDTNKIARLHDGLKSQGRNVPVWLTEYGWDSRWMDNLTRARMIDWVANWALDQSWLELAHYHMLHDTENPAECCYGLVGAPPTFVPKQPAYDAFRSIRVEGWAPRANGRLAATASRSDPLPRASAASLSPAQRPRFPRAE